MFQAKFQLLLLPSGGVSHTCPWSLIPQETQDRSPHAPSPPALLPDRHRWGLLGHMWLVFPPKGNCFLLENVIPSINTWNGKCLTFPIIWLLWEAGWGGETIGSSILFSPLQLLLDTRKDACLDAMNVQDCLPAGKGLIRS